MFWLTISLNYLINSVIKQDNRFFLLFLLFEPLDLLSDLDLAHPPVYINNSIVSIVSMVYLCQ